MTSKFAAIALALLCAVPALAAEPRIDRPGYREFAWDGGDRLQLSGTMIVRVRKDGPARMVVTGREEDVRRVTLRDGVIGMEGGGAAPIHGGRVEIDLSGASLNEVTVSGSGQVTLPVLQQRALAVRVSGSGQVRADGRVETLQAAVSGSGSVRLDGLRASQGALSLSGSGRLHVAALESAQVGISGSGRIHIGDAPRSLTRSITGSGQLQAGGRNYTSRDRD